MSERRTIKFTIIPDIIFSGTTIDYGDFDDNDNRGRESRRTFRLIPETPMVVSVDYKTGIVKKDIINKIRLQLRERVKDAIQVGMDNDISLLTGESNSPPIVLKRPTGYGESEQVQDSYIKSYVRAKFNVIKRSNINLSNPQSFGLERVFSISSPSLMNDVQFYNHKDDSLTCGYDYIVNEFGKKKGFIKIAKNKQAIDKAINNPTTEDRLIYNEWSKEYWDEFNTNKIDIDPLPNYIATNDIEDKEWYKINCVDLSKETYKNKEIEDSLCVLDIVKWCIRAKVRLNVLDHNNCFYLTYNPKQYKDRYEKKFDRVLNISMIVKYNHAYFVMDENIKTSLSLRNTKFNLELDIYTPAEKEKDITEDKTEIEKILIAEQDYIINKPNQPPPTLEKLIECMKQKKQTNYYVNTTNLNGLVALLFKLYKIVPTTIKNKNRTTIDKVVYQLFKKDKKDRNKKIKGGLSICSNKKRPPKLEYIDNDREDFYNQYGKLIDILPELNLPYIPTDTEIAQAIYNSIATEDINSMFNSNTRKLFFNNEIKPDNTRYNNNNTTYPTISFDFKRAYTTALKTNEFNYCVFDAVCHPVKYRGNFRPDRYYICKNLDDNLRGGYGKRLLYHGTLIRYIMDKLEIQSVIHPSYEIPKEYFDKFLETIDELDKKGMLENIAKPKALINNFIGAMKNKDGICDYNTWLINNKETAMRELIKGNVPIKLNDDCCWRKECMMVSKAIHSYNFQSAQPIRLQIMETINAQNFLLIKHYKVCLYQLKFIHNYQNDIKQRKILSKIRNKKSAIPKNKKFKDIDYEPKVQSIKTDAVYFQSPYDCNLVKKKIIKDFEEVETRTWLKSESMYKFINYVVDTFNENSDWKIVNENIMENFEYKETLKNFDPQIPVVLGKNKWKTDIDIKHKWDKDIGGKILLNHAIYNDGCWISGLGGRGKSELIIGLDKLVAKNKIRYRWIKAFYKITKPNQYKDLCEEWRSRNPVFYEKFAPTNIACNRIGGETLHKGLGIPVKTKEQALEEDVEDIEENFDYKSYINRCCERIEGYNGKKPCKDILVFDELSMIGGYLLSILAYIKLRIPRIKFILMGDLDHQLKPVGEENRNFVNSLVIKELVNHNKLTLHYNFRTGKTNDVLYEICRDNPQSLIRYGDDTIRNLCYTHKKRKEIIDKIQDSLENPIIDIETRDTKTGHNNRFKLIEGTPIIARKSNKDKDIFKNEIYYFNGIVDDKIKISNDRNEVELEDNTELKNTFCSGYCITIHKSQSQTYRDEYTIHEWGYISKKQDNFLRLRYTAMSRSDDYENKVFVRLT